MFSYIARGKKCFWLFEAPNRIAADRIVEEILFAERLSDLTETPTHQKIGGFIPQIGVWQAVPISQEKAKKLIKGGKGIRVIEIKEI